MRMNVDRDNIKSLNRENTTNNLIKNLFALVTARIKAESSTGSARRKNNEMEMKGKCR
jgi:hypothetical protein